MNKKTADDLINKAVKTAITEYSKGEKIKKKKKALHNTKLLLKNYNKILLSVEGAISEANQIDQELLIYTDEEEVYINSIRRSKLKSLIVITHIDKALELIKNECIHKGIPEKFEAFNSCLMEGMTYEDAAKEYNSSKQSISRWVNDITKSVSIQLFGVDGIDFI